MSYAEEIEAEFMVFEAYIEEAARRGIWTTKDGTEIRVEDMTDSHLANAIAFLERKNTGDIDIYMPWISRLKAEQKRRNHVSSVQLEPIRINLNEWIKVKLTDLGKEIYYHQYDKINQIAGKEICKPKFPKEDENGYTKFQLWCFIELYGEYMGITLPNVIEPLEIIYER